MALFIICHTLLAAAELTLTESAKMSAALKLVLPANTLQLNKSVAGLQSKTNAHGEAVFELLVKTSADIAALNIAGVQLQAAVGPIATVRATSEGVRNLAQSPLIQYIDISKTYEPCLDVSRSAIGADKVHNGNPGFRGDGVVVALFDSGIDWRHEDFINKQGKSRILFGT